MDLVPIQGQIENYHTFSRTITDFIEEQKRETKDTRRPFKVNSRNKTDIVKKKKLPTYKYDYSKHNKVNSWPNNTNSN